MTLQRILRQTGGYLFRFPLPLLVLQSFDLVSEGALSFMEKHENSRLLFAAVTFPVVWFMMVLSLAATFEFIRRARSEKRPTLAEVAAALGDKALPLLTTGVITGTLVIVGLMVILPGVYFLTIYLFVPCFVMFLPTSPAFTYLAESKDLTRGRFFPLLGLAIAIVLLSLGVDELQSMTESWIRGEIGQTLVRLVFTFVLGAAVNVFLSVCFLEIVETPNA